jgi:hypothetical protein
MREQAFKWLHANYLANFAPKPNRSDHPVNSSVNLPPAKKARLAGDVFLNDDDVEDEEEDEIVEEEASEVDQYLLLPQLSEGMAFDLLAWWKKQSTMWPNLAKMARQYLALPATSAGVERLFSNGGQIHSSLRKSTKEQTLEMMLYISQNG